MNCETCKDLIVEHLYGELDEARAAEMAEALDQCPECRAELEALRRVTGAIDPGPALEVPSALHEEIMAAARHEVGARQASGRGAWWTTSAFALAASALLAVGGVWGFVALTSAYQQSGASPEMAMTAQSVPAVDPAEEPVGMASALDEEEEDRDQEDPYRQTVSPAPANVPSADAPSADGLTAGQANEASEAAPSTDAPGLGAAATETLSRGAPPREAQEQAAFGGDLAGASTGADYDRYANVAPSATGTGSGPGPGLSGGGRDSGALDDLVAQNAPQPEEARRGPAEDAPRQAYAVEPDDDARSPGAEATIADGRGYGGGAWGDDRASADGDSPPAEPALADLENRAVEREQDRSEVATAEVDRNSPRARRDRGAGARDESSSAVEETLVDRSVREEAEAEQAPEPVAAAAPAPPAAPRAAAPASTAADEGDASPAAGGTTTDVFAGALDAYDAGRFVEARDGLTTWLASAAGGDPRRPEALYYRAASRLRLGDEAGARADLTTLVAAHPSHSLAPRARDLIETLGPQTTPLAPGDDTLRDMFDDATDGPSRPRR